MSDIPLDQDLPDGIELWNPAHRGAYMKGRRAASEGKTGFDCPYEDHRKDSGKLSWSRSFIRAWQRGHRDMRKLMEDKS